MRLVQKFIILCLVLIMGIFIGAVSSILIIKQSRRSIGEIYWKTVNQTRKLDTLAAIDKLKQFIDKYPNSDYVEDAYYNICKIRFKECVKTNQNWHIPIQEYFKLLSDYPKSRYLEPISFFTPFCYAKNKEYGTAIVKFKRFLKMFPRSDLADEAQYNIGRLYWALDKFKEAKKAYELVVKIYPNENLIDDALFRIGETELGQENYKEAILQFNQISKRFHKGEIAKYSQAMTGFCLYLERKFEQAKQTYSKVLSNYPNSPIKDDIKDFIDKMYPAGPVQKAGDEDIKTNFLCTDKGIIYNKKESLFLINFGKEDLNKIFPFNTKKFFSPLGDEFIVGSGDYLWKVGIDGKQKTKVTKQQGEKVNIIWSFDAKAIIYETEDALYLIRVNENKLTKLLDKSPELPSFFACWSKDSKKIACLNWSKDGSFADLIIFDSNGDRKKRIKKILDKNIHFSRERGFIWSWDSNKIAYAISRTWRLGVVEEIRMVDVNRGSVRTLIYDSATHICWSPDSSKIAYSNYRGTLVIDSNGKNWHNLSNIRMGSLRWSSNQTLCGIGIREDFFVYRILNLKCQTKKYIIKGTNPLLSEDGKLIAYNDDKGRLWLENLNSLTREILSYSKIKPTDWLYKNSKIICFDSNDYFVIDRYKREKQHVYSGTQITTLASFKDLTFVPKSYDSNSIFGNIGGNIVRLKDNTKYLITLKGGKNPVLSSNKKYVVYENVGNLWTMNPDGINKFQLTLLGGHNPNWFGDKIIFEQHEKTTLNWWDFNLKVNQKIHQEKGRIGKEYLLDVIQPVDYEENISIINQDGSNCTKLISQGSNPDVAITGKIAFERNDMIWTKNVTGGKESKLVKGKCPKWSCDGKTLAFLRDNNLWIMDKKIQDSIEHFDWLPAKNKIAYSKNGALFIKDVATDEVVQLTKSSKTSDSK
ncbi:MAG: tetratricopeptide repeat protein [bacterium]